MNRYAVSFISFHDNDLKTEIVRANHEREAILMHTTFISTMEGCDIQRVLPQTIEDIKMFCWDGDSMIDCVIIP
jgi:hypothetical protein